ncbi:unnamed protein product [Pleuronectes platessa]|uniref:Uncharacterized protein n=1 Tax=Pleuronectes platessa TaxID=8262 RepID=A0A9N7YDT0_PLEPL|nr:unnamed protein product [Pleuronectes platessa]
MVFAAVAQLPGFLDLCWNTQDESEHLCSFGHSSAHHMIRLLRDREWCRVDSPGGTEHQLKGTPATVKHYMVNSIEAQKHPLICHWGNYSQTLSERSVAISSCFDSEAADGI